ncbi:hypothetical protein D3C71_1730260 [compost metagenome]
MGHAMLMSAIAAELGIDLGTMHFTLAHPHVYDVHWDMANDSFRGGKVKSRLSLCRPASVSIVEAHPDRFVEEYRTLGQQVQWPEFHCRPEVVA